MAETTIFSRLTPYDIVSKTDTYEKCLQILEKFRRDGSTSKVINSIFTEDQRQNLMKAAVQKIVRKIIEQWFCMFNLSKFPPATKTGQFVMFVLSLLYGDMYEEGEPHGSKGTFTITQVHVHLDTLRRLLTTICYATDVESALREQVVLVTQSYMSSLVKETDGTSVVSDTIDTLALLSVITTETAIGLYAGTLEGAYDKGDTVLAFQYYDGKKSSSEDNYGPVYITTWHDWITANVGAVKGLQRDSPTDRWKGPIALLNSDRSKITGWVSGPMRLAIVHTTSLH